jgi:hypothetical protein
VKTTNYERHPLGACYPDLQPEEFELLLARIKSGEDMPPVQLFEGKVLDGWHYCKACWQLGSEPETVEVSPENPALFVIRRNEGRRHLTKGQLAKIALRIANVAKHSNQYVTKIVTQNAPTLTQTKAAEAVGVSRSEIGKASYADTHGGQEVNEALTNGEISTEAAYKIAHLPKEEQAAAVKTAKTAKAKPAKVQTKGQASAWEKWKLEEPKQAAIIEAPCNYPEGEALPSGDTGDESRLRGAVQELKKNEPLIPGMKHKELDKLIYPHTQAVQAYMINRLKAPRPEGDFGGQGGPLWKWAREVAGKMICRRNFLNYLSDQKKVAKAGKPSVKRKKKPEFKTTFDLYFNGLWEAQVKHLKKFSDAELPKLKERWLAAIDNHFQQRAQRAKQESNGN